MEMLFYLMFSLGVMTSSLLKFIFRLLLFPDDFLCICLPAPWSFPTSSCLWPSIVLLISL